MKLFKEGQSLEIQGGNSPLENLSHVLIQPQIMTTHLMKLKGNTFF